MSLFRNFRPSTEPEMVLGPSKTNLMCDPSSVWNHVDLTHPFITIQDFKGDYIREKELVELLKSVYGNYNVRVELWYLEKHGVRTWLRDRMEYRVFVTPDTSREVLKPVR